ncbi:hypothetical protein FOA52_008005 [Chlamydomonas sp. UWO 241]|nr:hypothetical protein FOA52_008005 [Chlamydomonas sp. UWO 241]
MGAGEPGQALSDALFAAAYAPQLPAHEASPLLEAAATVSASPPLLACAWAPALAACALAQEARGGKAALAALYMRQAVELCGRSGHTDAGGGGGAAAAATKGASESDSAAAAAAAIKGAPESDSAAAAADGVSESELSAYVRALVRMAEALPPAQRRALAAGGVLGLCARLSHEREEALPEVHRSRPKWYYYEHMMRERIEGSLERWSLTLPPPVVMAMVKGLDADDLDLMLRHPAGLLAQATELLHVLVDRGEAYLLGGTHRPQRLAWDEVQALTGGYIELGVPQAIAEGGEAGRYRLAMVAAAADGLRVRLRATSMLAQSGGHTYQLPALLTIAEGEEDGEKEGEGHAAPAGGGALSVPCRPPLPSDAPPAPPPSRSQLIAEAAAAAAATREAAHLSPV